MDKRKAHFISFILVGILFVASLIIIPNTVMANGSVAHEKNIITVKIEDGDTLWSIAREYYTKDYKSMMSYIKEIKQINKLKSDTIHEDCYLIIPYYE